MKKILKEVLLILLFIFSSNLVAEEVPFLLTAAAKGDLETVKAIIESGGSANTEDKDKLTALMYAVRKDNIEVVKYLIKKILIQIKIFLFLMEQTVIELVFIIMETLYQQ